LHDAAARGDFEQGRRLLDDGIAVDTRAGIRGYTALHYAAENGRIAVIELLLAKGAAVDARSRNDTTPLIVRP
jgi:ankyrin repeat protein